MMLMQCPDRGWLPCPMVMDKSLDIVYTVPCLRRETLLCVVLSRVAYGMVPLPADLTLTKNRRKKWQ